MHIMRHRHWTSTRYRANCYQHQVTDVLILRWSLSLSLTCDYLLHVFLHPLKRTAVRHSTHSGVVECSVSNSSIMRQRLFDSRLFINDENTSYHSTLLPLLHISQSHNLTSRICTLTIQTWQHSMLAEQQASNVKAPTADNATKTLPHILQHSHVASKNKHRIIACQCWVCKHIYCSVVLLSSPATFTRSYYNCNQH